ncbi:glycosyltransferase family 39 protein [Inmirania thermothiophila]|uniref:4-amino-4-deoxy-L-arabinose transferase-like glycosyltransferase n=1 Tax=Inmirania thermothiophila TaxID=1750597 RepID=A0A3N1Y0M6_9GAMM|nr:glycosyltransferase family 39 protein [Inmirania thermothiophila]ROR32393.1 4-amino-4-deoxy-L-arabinose transferase-like glycosyltransferase [Inmirania thermothiophila]
MLHRPVHLPAESRPYPRQPRAAAGLRRNPWAAHGWLAGWALLVATTLVLRQPVPIDETRYLAVAWEMWQRGDFLVPHLNGHPYAHKPPLLFWLFHLGWALFGVNAWWPRLVPPLLALAALWVTRRIAGRLWPDGEAALLAPWVLLGCLFWAAYMPATLFDLPLTAAVTTAIYGLVLAATGAPRRGWAVTAGGLAAGLLFKGPVALLPVASVALAGPWWSGEVRRAPRRWYGGFALAVLAGLAALAAWALPAAWAGGPGYADDLLWRQTADRVVESFAHRRPWWWYLPLLPVLLFPWSLWPPAWRGLGRWLRSTEPGLRMALVWVVPPLLVLSAASGKQAHYLLPLFPGAALAGARLAAESAAGRGGRARALGAVVPMAAAAAVLPGLPLLAERWLHRPVDGGWVLWSSLLVAAGGLILRTAVRGGARANVIALSLGGQVTALALTGMVLQMLAPFFDPAPMARRVAPLVAAGTPVAWVGGYHGQLHFAGRIRRPLDEVDRGGTAAWARAHPDGYVVRREENPPQGGAVRPVFVQPYRDGWLVLWRAAHERPPPERRGKHAPRGGGSPMSAPSLTLLVGRPALDLNGGA